MAIRGALLDVFPMGSEVPYRIDLLDDEVETLRTFDRRLNERLIGSTRSNLCPRGNFPSGVTRFIAFKWHGSRVLTAMPICVHRSPN